MKARAIRELRTSYRTGCYLLGRGRFRCLGFGCDRRGLRRVNFGALSRRLLGVSGPAAASPNFATSSRLTAIVLPFPVDDLPIRPPSSYSPHRGWFTEVSGPGWVESFNT